MSIFPLFFFFFPLRRLLLLLLPLLLLLLYSLAVFPPFQLSLFVAPLFYYFPQIIRTSFRRASYSCTGCSNSSFFKCLRSFMPQKREAPRQVLIYSICTARGYVVIVVTASSMSAVSSYCICDNTCSTLVESVAQRFNNCAHIHTNGCMHHAQTTQCHCYFGSIY